MLISIRHVTSYRYAEPVSYSIQSLRLTPSSFTGQRVVDWKVRTPGSHDLLEFEDGFGNVVHLLTLNTPHQELAIEAAGVVETKDTSGVVAGLKHSIPPRVFLKETPRTAPDAAIREIARSIKGSDMLGHLHALAASVRERVEYMPGMTGAHTAAAEALAEGKGVCQDHAHIFIAGARTMGVPARYITGYLVTGESMADAHHAWAEAWVEGLGWVGFDVANRVCPTDRYVRLAAGLDASYAAPITGSRKDGADEKLDVAVEVQQQSAQQ
jgi:transglutaminase-like putative cysteine protease